jgi:hypothetical protein
MNEPTGGLRVDFWIGDVLSDEVDSASFAGLPLDLIISDLRCVYHLPGEVLILVNDVPVSRTDHLLEVGDKVTLILGNTHNLDPADAAKPDVVGGGAAAPVPVLSERKYLILRTLLELDATSPDNRRATKVVAVKAEGVEADPEGYKKPVAELADLGYVATRGGRGGGCWLTATGKAVAEQMKG